MSLSIKSARAQYAGDPGLGSLLRKVAGKAIGLIPGGGLVRDVARKVLPAVLPGIGGRTPSFVPPAAVARSLPAPTRARPAPPSPPQVMPGTGRRTRVGASLGGGFFGAEVEHYRGLRGQVTRDGQAVPVGMKLACPSGYHPNKSDYFLKDGTFVAQGTKCVKNRRRNPANMRALDRAMTRLDMGKRLQAKLRSYSTKNYTATGKRKN